MKMISRRNFAAVSVAALTFFLLAGTAAAQYREFTGRIDKISDRKMIVDNRQGDKVSFVPLRKGEGDTEVSGEGKKSWDELKAKDWVTVSWKFTDKPRKAYIIKVLPPREEEE